MTHRDLGGFIEGVDPVHQVLLIVGLQEELSHPGVDDCTGTKRTERRLSMKTLGMFPVRKILQLNNWIEHYA